MSHVATIEIDITDLDALRQAAEDIGCELVKDQKTYKWYGRSMGDFPLPEGFTEEDLGKCEHAIRVKGKTGAYEIGVVPSRTGKGYTLLWDFWSGGYGLEQAVGKDGQKLQQGYARRATERAVKRAGKRVLSHKIDARGQIVLRVQ